MRRRPVQVGDVLVSQSGETLRPVAGTLIPWCERISPGSVTFSRAQPGPRSNHLHRNRAVGEKHRLADLEVVGQGLVAGTSADVDRSPGRPPTTG